QEFGTLASWGVDLVNLLSGNLDRPGGAMFPMPAAPITGLLKSSPFSFGRWKSRVSGQPEVRGRIPSSTMAEEMLTPGAGQVRAMILLMTNPLRSAANSRQLEAAFAGLAFLVAVGFYINETTRFAHVILPTASPAAQPNYEFGLYHLSVRNVAKWSSPVPASAEAPAAWQVLARLSGILMGMPDRSAEEIDDVVFRQFATSALATSSWPDLGVDEIVAKLDGTHGPGRIVDMLVRMGPYGDGFGRCPDGLSLDRVRQAPHGIDLGPLQPRLREVLNTASGVIELAPPTMLGDLPRLRARVAERATGMVLIGRRDLRASNSFMHNLPALVKGPDRCTLQVSPPDAALLRLRGGGLRGSRSGGGGVGAPGEVPDALMPGGGGLPRGGGHDAEGSQLSVARAHPGVNTNILIDDHAYDEASGTAVLFGTAV